MGLFKRKRLKKNKVQFFINSLLLVANSDYDLADQERDLIHEAIAEIRNVYNYHKDIDLNIAIPTRELTETIQKLTLEEMQYLISLLVAVAEADNVLKFQEIGSIIKVSVVLGLDLGTLKPLLIEMIKKYEINEKVFSEYLDIFIEKGGVAANKYIQEKEESDLVNHNSQGDVNAVVSEKVLSMESDILNASDGFGDSLDYWYSIIKQVAIQQHLDNDRSIDEQIKEDVFSHCDEYLNREDIQNSTIEEIEEFVKMRIYSFGELYTLLSSVLSEIEALLNENSIVEHPVKLRLFTESAHAKARTYGAIKLALRFKIPKEKIVEWFPGFEDDPGLIEGINPLERLAKQFNIEIPSSTPQYDLCEDESKNIPEWYNGPIENEERVLSDKNTDTKIQLNRIESTIYSLVEANIVVLASSVNGYKDNDENFLVECAREQIGLGLNWMQNANKGAYEILQNYIADTVKIGTIELLDSKNDSNPLNSVLNQTLFNGVQNFTDSKSFHTYYKEKINSATNKYQLGDYEGALEELDITVLMDPMYKNQYNLRGLCRAKLNDLEGSIEEYNRAIEIDGDYTPALSNRGDSRSNLGLDQEGFEDYLKVTEIDPKDAVAWDCCGLQKQKLKEFEASLSYFTRAIELEPENSNYYLSRGISRLSLGDVDGGNADFLVAKQLGNTQLDSFLMEDSNLEVKRAYYDNGSLELEYETVNGRNHGYYRQYHQNGQLQVELFFENGVQKAGMVDSYHSNGQLARRVIVDRNNQLNGEFEEFFPSGKIKTRGHYLNDKRYEREVYNEKGVREK